MKRKTETKKETKHKMVTAEEKKRYNWHFY